MAIDHDLGNVGISLEIIDELVVGQVVQPIVVRRAQHRKHAEPIGGQFIEPAISEQRVMRRLVSEGC